tara:strand:- start:2436 stop:3569 length:1134 start_codon:yes stop_codon:yes gene_type:complete
MTDERRKEVLKILGLKKPVPKEQTIEEETKDLINWYEKTALKLPVPYSCSHQSGLSQVLVQEVLEKHTTDCIMYRDGEVVFLKAELTPQKNKNQKVLALYIKSSTHKFDEDILNDDDFYKKLAERYLECKKNGRSLVIPLSIFVKDGGGHANLLLFNHIRKELEHFEPHGSKASHLDDIVNKVLEKLDENILEKVNKNLPNDEKLKYVKREEICPVGFKSFQSHENISASNSEQGKIKIGKKNVIIKKDNGFCCAWSYLYLDFRLKTLSKSPEQVSKFITEKYGLPLKWDNIKQGKHPNFDRLKSWIRGLTNKTYERYLKIIQKTAIKEGLSEEQVHQFILYWLFDNSKKTNNYRVPNSFRVALLDDINKNFNEISF